MSQDTLNLTVGQVQAVPVEVPNGGSAVITVGSSGGTVYYSDHQVVTASVNQGSIAAGGSQTFTNSVWLIASAPSPVKVVTSVGSTQDVILGSDGTVGGPGGTQLTSSTVSAASAAGGKVPVSDGANGYAWATPTGGATVTSVTLGATNSLSAPSSSPTTLVLTQDGTGGRTITGTWWAGILWAGGAAPTLSTAPGAVDVLTFVQVSSTWYGFVVGLNMQAAPSGSPLLTNLAESWLLNETTGTRLAAVNGSNLTEYAANTATPGNVTRVAGPGGVNFAAHFAAANHASLRAADSTALELGAASSGWHIWCWYKLDSNPGSGAYGGLMSKRDGNFGLEYSLSVFNNGGTHQIDFRGAPGGEMTKSIGTFDTAWHLVEAWWDPAAGGTMNIAFDHGAPTSEASANVTTRASTFAIGNGGDSGEYLDGAIAWPSIRKQVPTSGDRALIWNGGAGRPYPFA